jgi:hydroxyacylglutathione hydrolase
MKIKQFKLGPMDNFSYVLWDPVTKEAAVADPAWSARDLGNFLRDEGLALKYVLLTHAHPDHINGVNYFAGKPPHPPVCLHEGDYFMLESRPEGLRGLADGETLALGGERIKVLHTPGHTPGSVCFLAKGALLSGDTMFVGECGRVDLPGSSAEELFESFSKLASLPDDCVLYPGHSYNGDTSTLRVQKEYNLYLKLARQGRRDDFLRAVR